MTAKHAPKSLGYGRLYNQNRSISATFNSNIPASAADEEFAIKAQFSQAARSSCSFLRRQQASFVL